MLVVIAGPSGVGKGPIVRALLAQDPRLWFSVSLNTRAPRPGEVDGVDYRFVDRAEFERLRDQGGLLEWFQVYDDLKGTPRAPVEEHLAAGDDVVLELDVQGARALYDAVFPQLEDFSLERPLIAQAREALAMVATATTSNTHAAAPQAAAAPAR